MKILSRCEACKKLSIYISKRVYKHKVIGPIKSQSEVCFGCYRKMKKILKLEQMNNGNS